MKQFFFSEFPSTMKLADKIPVFKKDDMNLKHNYRRISILLKVFEKIIHDQISIFFSISFQITTVAVEKALVSNIALLQWFKKWKKTVDNGTFGALLASSDLSKAFDCIPHELLIAKLSAYGFNFKALKFIYSYSNNRKQRVRINESFSEWAELLFGVPQGSILGLLLVVIFLCDSF